MVTFKCSSWLCKLQGKAEIYARAGQISATLRQFRAGSSSSNNGSRKVRMALNECCIVFVTKTFAHFLQHCCWGSTGQQGRQRADLSLWTYPFALLFCCCFIFTLSGATFLLFWAQLMVQKVNWREASPAQATCSCRLPTTQKEEGADRAKSFGSVPVAFAVAAPRTGANYSSSRNSSSSDSGSSNFLSTQNLFN